MRAASDPAKPLAGEAKVSVVIPAYNVRPYIEEAIGSAVAQAYEPLEVVVSDDGSTDGTTAIIEELAARHPRRVVHVRSERNTGIAGAFNRALAVMTGELIAWLGGDDVMLPGKIAKQVARLRERPDAVACVHDAEVFDSDTGRVHGRFSELTGGRRGLREGGVELLFDPSYLMLPSATMIRASAAPPEGFDDRLRVANDWLFDIGVFRRGRCVVVDEVLVRYRRHSASATMQSAREGRDLEEALTVLAVAQARYPDLTRLIRRRRAALLLGHAWRVARSGDRRRAAACASAALSEGGPIGTLAVGSRLARVLADRRALGLPDQW